MGRDEEEEDDEQEITLYRRIWDALRDERKRQGRQATWAADRIGVSSNQLWRWETKGSGRLHRAAQYCELVLERKLVISLPCGAVTIEPLSPA